MAAQEVSPADASEQVVGQPLQMEEVPADHQAVDEQLVEVLVVDDTSAAHNEVTATAMETKRNQWPVSQVALVQEALEVQEDREVHRADARADHNAMVLEKEDVEVLLVVHQVVAQAVMMMMMVECQVVVWHRSCSVFLVVVGFLQYRCHRRKL